MGNFTDLTGKTFGRLRVITRSLTEKSLATRKRVFWECKCECGKPATVSTTNLNLGIAKSCGCYHRDRMRTHGATVRTDSGRITPEYQAWQSIKLRCFKETTRNYMDYGGRGITMFAGWINDYQAFFDHIGKRPSSLHSVDRINNDGNYEPGNVRWATKKEQANNRRNTRFYTISGETKSMSEWCDLKGLLYGVVCSRMNIGMSFEEAINKPCVSKKKQPTNALFTSQVGDKSSTP